MTPAATIYCVTNLTNAKRYVGVTEKTIEDRWKRHVQTALRGSKIYFHHAIVKYGASSFAVEPLASIIRPEAVGLVEREFIAEIKPEYNQTSGGEWFKGYTKSPESIEKVRRANLGKKRTPEQNAAMSAEKKRQWASMTREQRADAEGKLKAARCLIDEAKRAAAAGASARDRVWTEESRAKLSASRMGIRHTAEVLTRISEKKMKKVRCLNNATTYNSVSDAAISTGMSISGVSKVCLGKRNSCHGMRFEFVE